MEPMPGSGNYMVDMEDREVDIDMEEERRKDAERDAWLDGENDCFCENKEEANWDITGMGNVRCLTCGYLEIIE